MQGEYYSTWKRALFARDDSLPYRNTKPYHLVVQDDLKFCVDFEATVDKIIQNALEHFKGGKLPILSLYCPKSIIAQQKGKGVNFVRMIGGSWGQSHLFPVSRIDEFLQYDKETFAPEYDSDDGRLTFWSCDTKEPFWVTAPSLLEHLAPSASTLGYNNKTKVAAWFAGDESPLKYAWNFSYSAADYGSSMSHQLELKEKGNTLTEFAKKRFGISTYGDGTIRRK